MRKLFVTFLLFVFSILAVIVAGEKRIVGARVNNQIMLLRVDMANYSMDASTDGTTWSGVKLDWSNVLNPPGVALLSGAVFTGNVSVAGAFTASGTVSVPNNVFSLSKIAQIATGSVLGNVSGTTGNVTILSVSDLKALIGNVTDSTDGLISSADKSKLDGLVSGYKGYYATESALETAHAVGADGDYALIGETGTVWAWIGSAWANTSSVSALSWDNITGKPSFATVATSGSYADLSNTPSNATTSVAGLMSSTDKTKLDGLESGGGGVSSVSDLTDVSLTSLSTGDSLVYESGTGTTKSLCHFDNSFADEVGEATFAVLSGTSTPSYAAGEDGFGTCLVFGGTTSSGSAALYHSTIEHLYTYTAFTLDFWICPDLTAIASNGSNVAWVLSIRSELKIYLRGSGSLGLNISDEISLGEASALSNNTWAHVRLVRDGSDYYLYVNGSLIASGNATIPTTSTRRLIFGMEDSSSPDNNTAYRGKIDEFRFLDEALVGEFTPPTAPYTVPSGVWKNQALATVATTGSYDDLSDTPSTATTSAAGLMSAADKTKLDGLNVDTVASSETTVTTSYTADWDTATIHRIKTTASTECALTVQDIPLGKALVIRVDNSAAGSVSFGGNTIISTSSATVRFISFTNVTGTIELVQ